MEEIFGAIMKMIEETVEADGQGDVSFTFKGLIATHHADGVNTVVNIGEISVSKYTISKGD